MAVRRSQGVELRGDALQEDQRFPQREGASSLHELEKCKSGGLAFTNWSRLCGRNAFRVCGEGRFRGGRTVCRVASRAVRSSAGVWKRSAGFLANMRPTSARISGGSSSRASNGGGLVRCWERTCAKEPENGTCPESAVKIVAPSE